MLHATLRSPGMVRRSIVPPGMVRATGAGRVTRAMNGGVQSTVGTMVRMMICRMVARAVRTVNMGRIMPGTTVPGRRSPGRHKASSRQCPESKDSSPVGVISIHRTTVAIAVNRETIGIITCGSPGGHITIRADRHRTRPTDGDPTVRSHRHKTRTEKQR